jgi:hypothetical protein
MSIELVQSAVRKDLGMSTIVGYDLSKCVSVETKAATSGLDLSDRKVCPTHVVIDDGVQSGEVLLPSASAHKGRAIEVVNNDAAEAVDVGSVSCVALKTTVIYSNGSSWVKLKTEAF